MTQVIEGVIHGRTIELEGDPGIEDGRKVQVVLQVESPYAGDEVKGKTAAGMMASYTDDDDAVLAEIYQDRRRDTRREPPL